MRVGERLANFGWLFLLFCMIAGCEKAVRKSAAIATVTGEVTLDGEPLANAKILFVPIQVTDAQGSYLEPSYATTDDEGQYELFTQSGRKGACVGRHMVWVRTRQDEQHDLPPQPLSDDIPPEAELGIRRESIPGRYHANTELYFYVAPGEGNIANFELRR